MNNSNQSEPDVGREPNCLFPGINIFFLTGVFKTGSCNLITWTTINITFKNLLQLASS